MIRSATEAQVRNTRLRAQRLDASACTTPAGVADVVRAAGGLQAQDHRAALLGVRARSRGLTVDDVERARVRDRSIVRMWCMRGTLHLVPADLLPDLLAVFGPVYVPRGRRRLAQLGLDDQTCEAAMAVIADVLAGQEPLTRHEIAAALLRGGITFDPRGQAPIHLVRRACLLGITCEAGHRDGQPTYAWRDDWLPGDAAGLRAAAVGRLARWYVSAFQPTSRDDFAAWSGLPAADVRRGWEQLTDLVALADDARHLWLDAAGAADVTTSGPPAVRLLPAFDSYLLGYRDRTHAVAREQASRVQPGGGIIRPTLVVDGTVAGIWRIDRSRRPARLDLASFAGVGGAPVGTIQAEVDDIARFLDLDLTLTMVGEAGPARQP